MAAARQRAFSGDSRKAAIAAIQICWKQMRPDLYYANESRDERLEWIGKFLGIKDLRSITDLTDDQLGAVAGEMKRLTGVSGQQSAVSSPKGETNGNVVRATFGREDATPGGSDDHETVFLSSPEMVYTIEKLIAYVGWDENHVHTFLAPRFGKVKLRMLTFVEARSAVNQFLHIAAHRDLKKRNGGKPVSRKDLDKYIPILKRELRIDQTRQALQ